MMMMIELLALIMLIASVNAAINSILQKQMRSVNIGKELGLNFESEVRNILLGAGYRNVFNANDNVNGVFVHMGKKSSEFDAIVHGNKNSFGNFCDCFVNKYICSPPNGDSHMAIVEAKLNCRNLIDWIKEKEGSKYLFFNENSTQEFTKILVLNGGSESEAFVKNLSSDDVDIKEYADVKKVLKKAKINVFYQLWASGESFADVTKQCHDLQNENQEIKIKNEEIMKLCHFLQNENQEIKIKIEEIMKLCHFLQNENQEIKKQIASIVSKRL